jgi:hypothetical protein
VLAFTSVYFFEPGLFNELRAIQIKNFLSLVSGCVQPPLRPPREARVTAKLPPAGGDCHTMESEFLQDIALFREWRRAATLAANRRAARDAALSFVERLGAADERIASNIKPQNPLRIPRNADPHAFSDFPLADLARLSVIARDP